VYNARFAIVSSSKNHNRVSFIAESRGINGIRRKSQETVEITVIISSVCCDSLIILDLTDAMRRWNFR